MKDYERLLRKFGKAYKKGTCIFKEGEEGKEVYYILSGMVQVEKRAGQGRKILTRMGQGEYFGEMAPLTDDPRTASVIAMEDSSIAVIPGNVFCDLLEQSRPVSLLILKEFSQRLKHSNEALEKLTISWVKSLIVLYLFKAWPLGEDQDSIAELAEITGKDPAEIDAVLTSLSREGIIEYKHGKVSRFITERIWKIFPTWNE